MNTVLLADFVDRLLPLQCLQAYLRLELRSVGLPFLRLAHRLFFLLVAYSLNYCPDIGVHYTRPRNRSLLFVIKGGKTT